jgi:hypothetical protein
VHDLLADVPEFVSTPEIRVDCGDDVKFALVEKAVAHFRAVTTSSTSTACACCSAMAGD